LYVFIALVVLFQIISHWEKKAPQQIPNVPGPLKTPEAARKELAGRWKGVGVEVPTCTEYLDLRVDATYHIVKKCTTELGPLNFGHSGTWEIVDRERKLIELSGGPTDHDKDHRQSNDISAGGSVDLTKWTPQ
jgi:hypothetical protein